MWSLLHGLYACFKTKSNQLWRHAWLIEFMDNLTTLEKENKENSHIAWCLRASVAKLKLCGCESLDTPFPWYEDANFQMDTKIFVLNKIFNGNSE